MDDIFVSPLVLGLAAVVTFELVRHRRARRVEAALRASEVKFSTAFWASPDSIVISSFPEGTIIEVNQIFVRVTGWSREEAIGRCVHELGIWPSLAEREQLLASVRAKGRLNEMEVSLRMRTGAVRRCVISGALIELEGRPCLMSVSRDITERRQAEVEREAFVRELEAKNAELERFAYTVSHDLKSPLVTIRGFLGLLEQDLAAGDAERLARDMERIRVATETMKRLLDELLQLSRVGCQMNPPQEVALYDLAQEAAALVAGQIAERGVGVEIEMEMPVVSGDRPRLLEVWQNLIDNAVKFIGSEPSPKIEIGARREATGTVFYVRDNGVGIDPRHREKVFGLFEKLDPQVEGTGIGLALVKRIVELHGGRVWVESAGSGKGSSFCFTLPGAAVEAARPQKK